jgi:hypothetical protein
VIIVYGLEHRQSLRLEREFGAGVRCWPRKLQPSVLVGVEAVVVAIRFVGHQQENAIARLYGRHRIRRVWGCECAIRRELRRLLTTVT